MTEWFRAWFGEEYLDLYPHRDDADAERVVDLVARVLPWQPGWRVLDVACGAGRHARALEAAGARCVGVDLSMPLLRRAREATRAPLVRADMRKLPIRLHSMDLTVNLFTSFGYFVEDEEHVEALREMLSTVRHGGWFVLDFLNAETVRSHLVERDLVLQGEAPVHITRRLSEDGRFVSKTITMIDGQEYLERVRLFTPAELETMLADLGLAVAHRFGSYDGGPLRREAPRTVLVGQVA